MADLRVLGEEAEHQSFLSAFYVVYFTAWMTLMPLLALQGIMTGHVSWEVIRLLAYSGLLLTILYIGRLFFRVRLVLDPERQEILLHRQRMLVFNSYKPLMGAEALWGTTWAGEIPQAPFTWWWCYSALLITQDGRRFRCATNNDSQVVEDHAKSLADELGIEFTPGKEGHITRVSAGPRFAFRAVPVAVLDLFCVVFWAIAIFPGIIFMVWGLIEPFSH
jgi:hypothetical protein